MDVPGSANLHIAGSRGQFADTNLFSIDNTYIESVAAALAVWEISRASGSCDRDPVNSLASRTISYCTDRQEASNRGKASLSSKSWKRSNPGSID